MSAGTPLGGTTLAEVARLTGGRLVGGADPAARLAGPVVVDSRLVGPGALFVAVPGERVDGHDFAAGAVGVGAVAALVAREVDAPAVLVADPVAALGALARASVDRLTADGTTVVGLTGSSGKTSTKDLLAQVLAVAGPTVAPQGSYNNELGVPLTALTAPWGTRHLVVEMGARGAGHIALLCSITPPRVGLVLNVGSAHSGEFGGREATAAAKSELVRALPADGGVAVLNADDPLVAAMAGVTSARVVTFGVGAGADVRAEGVRLDDRARPAFRLVTPEGSADVRLALHGEHHVSNALGTAAVAREAGLDVAATAAALGAAGPRSRWRMEVADRADGVTVVNDAYNANPESVAAALRALTTLAGDRRSWAVLGEMRELGAASATEHESVGRLAARLGVSRVVAVGGAAEGVRAGAAAESRSDREREESVLVPDAEAALALLREQLRPGDVVLVKASRAAGLEQVAEALLAEGGGR